MGSYHRPVYSLGTSIRSGDEFVRLLRCYGVELVVDVRRFPVSRFEHFNQQELARLLAEKGIGYLYLGDKLGGYRRGGYPAFVNSEEFNKGMEMLEIAASEKVSAIVCAERLPWRCHRRFIAAELEKKGWEVKHIINENRVWSPKGYSATIRETGTAI